MKIKHKEVVLLALLTAVYIIVYMVSMFAITPLGAFGHSISPGFCALLSGAIIIFINRKIGKMWEYTIFSMLIMGVFTLMGVGYIPWIITSLSTAVIADIVASRSNKTSIPLLGVASGLIHMGQAWGSIIPSTFFLEAYRSHWIERGMKAAEMDEQIKFTKDLMGLLSTGVVFALSFIGVLLGYAILKKHLEKMK